MTAIITILCTIWTTIWSFLSPIKWYILTAIVAIVLWQSFIPQTWFARTDWPTVATAVSVDMTGTALIVDHVSSDIFNRKRMVKLEGIAVSALAAPAAQVYLTKLISTNRLVLSVASGARLGAGDLAAVVYTPDGTCVNLALICKGLATCTDNKRPKWATAQKLYGGK